MISAPSSARTPFQGGRQTAVTTTVPTANDSHLNAFDIEAPWPPQEARARMNAVVPSLARAGKAAAGALLGSMAGAMTRLWQTTLASRQPPKAPTIDLDELLRPTNSI